MERVLARSFDVTCPYCKQVVIQDYFDPRSIDEDMTTEDLRGLLSDGYELVDEDEVYGGDGGSLCGHVALFGVWGYMDPEVTEEYRDLLGTLAQALDSESDANAEYCVDLLMDAEDDEALAKLQARMNAELPDHDVSLVREFVPDASGPRGDGGPTYLAIFVRKKPGA